MTNHTYWNLSGDFKIKNVRTHRLKLFCDKMVEVDELHNLPQGPLKEVDDTPFDFRTGGEKAPWMLCSLQRLDGAISHGLDGFGIDDQMVINNPKKDCLVPACRLIHHTSRRELNIFTTQPCLQVYTANCLQYPQESDKPDENPADRHRKFAAIALEPTGFNNAVNMIGKEGWPTEDQVFYSPKKMYRHAAVF